MYSSLAICVERVSSKVLSLLMRLSRFFSWSLSTFIMRSNASNFPFFFTVVFYFRWTRC